MPLALVVDELGGSFPDDPADLKKLPGIGAYTAGAIAAFAHERDVAFLDTNMRRVISRVVFGTESAPEVGCARSRECPGPAWSGMDLEPGVDRVRSTAVHGPPSRVHHLSAARRVRGLPDDAGRSSAQVQPRRVRAKAEPFERTTRFYRGRIVEALRALPADEPAGIPLAELGAKVREEFTPENLPWLRRPG